MVLPVERLAYEVARTLVARPFTWVAVEEALVAACGGSHRNLTRLATALVRRFGGGPRPRLHDVAAWLAERRSFERLIGADRLTLEELPPPVMLPLPGAPSTWNVPPIPTTNALAEWLQLPTEVLAAWCRSWRPDSELRDDRLQHYHRRWVPRRGGLPRLLEAPKARLKAAQRRVLTGILANVPPHDAAHGFVKARSCASFVAPHVGTACVLRLDLADFFASIPRARVRGVFSALGYPIDVAEALADLCTSSAPPRVLRAGLAGQGTAGAMLAERLRRRHLPQGAPTSPALANLVAFHLDARLTGLARRFGARYTRYADDLLFSGGASFARESRRCAVWVMAVLQQEGFTCAVRKTRRMPQGVAQRAGGLVLNVHAAVSRREREQLEAILVNCARRGPSTQNRSGVVDFAAHLRGCIAHVAQHDAAHAAPLWRWFDAIDWSR